jgi:hypothetical protein
MALRDTLNENPRVITGITVALIVIVLAVLLWPGGGEAGNLAAAAAEAKVFFTIDDGATHFPDDAKKVAPFQKDGKEAVRAHVFQCGTGTPFVNHLSRFVGDGKRAMEEAMKKGGRAANDPTLVEGMEVKAPKGKEWVKITDPKAQAILQVKCPGGGTDAKEVGP